jgi:hypothetical protein
MPLATSSVLAACLRGSKLLLLLLPAAATPLLACPKGSKRPFGLLLKPAPLLLVIGRAAWQRHNIN